MRTPSWLSTLSEFLVDTTLDDIPDAVRHDGRLSLLDTVGCMLGGTTATPVRALAQRMSTQDGTAPIVGTGRASTPPRAALVGGIAATWLDLDTGHRHPAWDPPVPAVHPPAHTVPCLLALAGPARLSGPDLLRTYLVSYELGARLGIATTLRPGLHVHGVQPTVAVAAAAALCRSSDPGQVRRAIELGASLCLLAPFGTAFAGATVRNAYAGVGAAHGILADRLAAAGVTAPAGVFPAVFGETVSTSFDPDVLLYRLGRDWETPLGYFKVHACCRWNHPALDAIEDLRASGPVAADDVDDVQVDTFAFAAAMSEPSPVTDLGAKFSLPWAVAASLTLGTTDRTAFDQTALSRPDVRALARRVRVREEPEFSAALPSRRPTRITVRLRDGRSRSSTVQGSRGDPGTPFPEGTLTAKFAALAGAVLGADHAERACRALLSVESQPDTAPLLALLSGPPGRPE